MLNIIVFLVGFIIIVFFCIFLYNGGTIYDLITFSNYNSIYDKINTDIKISLQNSNKVIEYNVAPSEIYIYKTSEDSVSFVPLLNQISITQQDKTVSVLDVNKDVARLVPVFAGLAREFNYTAFNIS